MNFLVSFAYLAVCGYGALRIATRLLSGQPDRPAFPAAALLIWVLLCFVLFQAGFHILGYVELALGPAIVDPPHALAVVAAMLMAYEWFSRGVPVDSRYRPAALREWVRVGVARELWHASRLLAAAAATILICCVMLLFQFPEGYEAHAYHLPVGMHLFQAHSLGVWDRAFMHVLPASDSLYFGFLLQFLPERLAGCGNALFALPFGLAVYGTARGLGADKQMSALVTAGLFTIPLVAFGLFEAGADIGGMTFVAVAVYLVVVRPVGPIATAVLAGMAAGAAYGFKVIHLLSIGYLFVVVAGGFLKRANDDAPFALRMDLAGASLFALAALATGGFWMVRAYHLFDNPFYPTSLPLVSDLFHLPRAPDLGTGAAVQSQWVRSAAEWFVYPWVEWHMLNQNFKHSSGLGAFFAATAPVAYALVLAKLLFGSPAKKVALAVLWTGATLVFAGWWVTVREPRYFMAVFAYLVPVVAWTFSRTSGGGRTAFNAIATVAIATMLLVVLSKQTISFGDHIVFSKQFHRAQYYEYPEVIDRLPAGATIGVMGSRRLHYAMFGAGLRNRVVSYPEVMRALGMANGNAETGDREWPAEITLTYAAIVQLQVTHLYLVANTELRAGPCVTVEEIGRLDRNPLSKVALPEPRRVYKVTLCAGGPNAVAPAGQVR